MFISEWTLTVGLMRTCQNQSHYGSPERVQEDPQQALHAAPAAVSQATDTIELDSAFISKRRSVEFEHLASRLMSAFRQRSPAAMV